MIDISVKQKPEFENLWGRLAILALACWGVLYFARRGDVDVSPRVNFSDTVVLLDSFGSANSSLIDEWADRNNVELRRYSSSADTSRVEPEIAKLISAGRSITPSVVILKSGKVTSKQMPADLLEYLKKEFDDAR